MSTQFVLADKAVLAQRQEYLSFAAQHLATLAHSRVEVVRATDDQEYVVVNFVGDWIIATRFHSNELAKSTRRRVAATWTRRAKDYSPSEFMASVDLLLSEATVLRSMQAQMAKHA